MEGLTASKQSCDDFTKFLSEHDIICLTETWTSKNSRIELNGYSNPIHSYRRFKNRRAKRSSGGIIVYIKDDIRQGIKLVKNNVDCLIWIKLEKNFFSIEEDIYIGITYIAPENSPIHDIYSVDIFKTIQDDTSFFLQHGKVFLLGDLNSRTSTKTDFIEHDRPMRHEYHIEADAPIPRFSLDNGTNRFGDLLLNLCKSSSLRIVNGRLFNDKTVGKMTCYTHNGESVIDYLLTSFSNFSSINDFEIQNFNEYSNHAPLYFGLNVYTNRAEELQQERTYYKWNDDLKGTFLHYMTRDVHHLNRFISDGIS